MSSYDYVFTKGAACRLQFAVEIVGGATEYDGPAEIFEPTCATCTMGSYASLSVCLSVCLSVQVG